MNINTRVTLTFNKQSYPSIVTLFCCVVIGLMLLPWQSVVANQTIYNQWKTWKASEDIKIEYRNINTSKLIEIKASTTIQSSLSGFLLFLQDTDNIHQWLDNADTSHILETISPQENIFITQFKRFWPISERYMVIQSRYWQNEDLSIQIAVNDVDDEKYTLKSKIKIDILKAHWHIKPITNSRIHIEYSVIADPNGSLPLWLIRRLSLRSLWKTMDNLQNQLPISPWQKQSVLEIKELQ